LSDLSVQLRTTTAGTPLHVARFTNGRRRNAVNLATVEALHTLLVATPDDAVVLGSATPDIFCAGADLTVPDQERAEISDRLYACYEAMVRRPGVVVAVVEGSAVGGGAQLAAAADLRVAGPRARWRWVGPGHGLAVGAWILPDLLGRARGIDLAMTGRWLQLDEAERSGFVHRVAEDPWSTALTLLDSLAGAQPEALARVKSLSTPDRILAGLAAERAQNRDGWDGSAPTPTEASRDSRR
jgi:enoyl-CoA hydratase/carnithine racemase